VNSASASIRASLYPAPAFLSCNDSLELDKGAGKAASCLKARPATLPIAGGKEEVLTKLTSYIQFLV